MTCGITEVANSAGQVGTGPRAVPFHRAEPNWGEPVLIHHFGDKWARRGRRCHRFLGIDLVNRLVNFNCMEIAISEFKAKCIQLIKTAAENDGELLVTLRGKPMAKVTGIPAVRQRVLGGQRDALAGELPNDVLLTSDFESDWES